MKKIEKILGISAMILLLLLANLLFFLTQKYVTMTGNSVLEKYSYTKAICDKNVCQDYEISCQNNQLIYKQPITEKVYFSEGWKDPRREEDIKKLC